MISFIRRAAVVCGTALFVFSLPIAHMVPTAHAASPNPGLDASGQWTRSGPGFVANATTGTGDDLYIVGHQAPALSQYRGDIPGYVATSPAATGASRLDPDSAASQAYLAYLEGRHADLASAIQARIGRAVEVAYRYDAVFNGIAVRLNPTEAQQISTLAGIRSVTRDYSRELHTDNGPKWIGADAIWGEEPVSGNAACVGNCGEGIVAGIIDTGVNANHPSFADIGGDGYDHSAPTGMLTYKGACSAQPVGAPGLCNDKLIGYYDFTGTSPEDDNGHGSHTASTTAGNVLDITLQGNTINVDRSISGVAPHANIISYKGCSGTPVGCLISALLGAINAATLDVVDVINYSIGGSSANPWADLDAQAFFGAYEAGIFVATSASNDGPGFGTLGSPADAPWVTSVGASTHDRKLANGVVNMSGGNSSAPADIIGKGITSSAGPAEIVYAGDYPSTETATPELCGAGTGDPATGEGTGGSPWTGQGNIFAGKIVLCDRGEYGRVAKGGYVQEHGAIGYILTNDEANGDSLVADNHVLPGVHISYSDGLVLKGWLDDGGTGHTGRIAGLEPGVDPAAADVMASFSSRGANPAAPSLIKPDVTAPGVDILAAWMAAPEVTLQDILLQDSNGEQYNIISGTSMSSPHTAGAGALIRAVHPDWTPDEVKSALMTTAFNTMANGNNGDEVHGVLKEDALTPADPFDMGAGRVDLHVAADAGFVLGETAANYTAADPGAGGDVTTLNIASLGNDDCGTFSVDGTCSWTRTIRSTASSTISWNVTTTGDSGMVVTASPGFFTLAPGQMQTIEFTADVSASPKHEWIFGEVRFMPSGSVPPAHFPVAVIPKPPGGGGNGLDLFFHGNTHDACATGAFGTYEGKGETDVAAGCVPFLSTDDVLDTADAATWGPLQPLLNGTTVDPHWVWTLDEDVRLAGPMVIKWWASQASTTPLFDTNFDVTVTVDGTPHVLDHEVAHTFVTPGVPQLLTSVVPIPDITATSTVELKIDAKFIDSGNTVTFYYDSVNACTAAASGACDSRVTMPVIDGPIPPVANDDFVFIGSGETIAINVLANDFDPEGGPLAVQIISGPSNGTADLTAGNSIVYTHNGSSTSSDTIVYRITDNDGLTADGTVHISIAGSCVAAPDYSYDAESGAGDWTVDTAVLIGAPLTNTWELTLDANAHSPVTTWYTDALASDPVDNADISKDVRLVSPEFLVSGGTILSFWHSFNTEAEFDGGVLEITTDGGANWQDINAAGGFFLEGGYNSLVGALSRPGWSGTSSAYPAMNLVRVNLGAFNSETIQFRFRLAQDVLLGVPTGWAIDDVGLNNLYESCDGAEFKAPVAFDDTDTVTAGGTTTTNVKANDTDEDTDHADLTVTEIVTQPQHGTAMIVSPGHGADSVEYTHNGDAATSDFYEYRVEDQDNNSAVARVNITIEQAENSPPDAVDDMATVDAGESVTVDVKANDSDPDNPGGDLSLHTVTIETSPANGSAGVDGDGNIIYTHNGNTATSDSFSYRLTDPQGAFDVATVTITINQDSVGECRNDLCDNGDDGSSDDPDELTLTFMGGTCAASDNTQGSKDDCVDHDPAGASGDVVIKVTNKEDADYDNAKIFFYGAVSEGGSFDVSAAMADENDLGSKIFVHIYDANGNTLLQTVEIHTSCSAPLIEGERFGSLKLGGADADPSDPICTSGEGRVHGSGHWSRGTGDKHDKIDFSFDAKVYKGGFKGKLKVHDKDIDLKIDAKTITSLSTGEGQMCDGITLNGVNSFTFTATGKFEFGDEEMENARFFACGEDNGKNKDAPFDNLYVECVESCGYSTAVRIMDSSNDISGGNIHLHDTIVDPTPSGAQPAAMQQASAPEGNARQSAPESSPQSASQSEPESGTDTVALDPILLSTVPAGTPMIVTAIVETHGGVIDGTPVTLRWTTAEGLEGEATSLANAYGIAVFAVTVPAGDIDYTAWVDGVDSNGLRLTGF